MADPMAEFNKKVIDEFRSSGGKVSGQFAGAPMIIITHKGAKSGNSYTSPLVYSKDGDRYVIIASKAGALDFHDPVEIGAFELSPPLVVRPSIERGDRLLAAGLGQGAVHGRGFHELGVLPSRRHPGAAGEQQQEPGAGCEKQPVLRLEPAHHGCSVNSSARVA